MEKHKHDLYRLAEELLELLRQHRKKLSKAGRRKLEVVAATVFRIAGELPRRDPKRWPKLLDWLIELGAGILVRLIPRFLYDRRLIESGNQPIV